jgi:hypothetical protein
VLTQEDISCSYTYSINFFVSTLILKLLRKCSIPDTPELCIKIIYVKMYVIIFNRPSPLHCGGHIYYMLHDAYDLKTKKIISIPNIF